MNEIQKNVPLPPPLREPRITDAMRNMVVGDSVTVDAKTAPCLRFMARRREWKVRTRKTADGTFTVWRTA